MLKSLTIKNYALIKDLHIDFENGFTAITGETGAGKSIILGAMHLMMGQRADLSSVQNQNEKCITEGTFAVSNYHLQAIFDDFNLDYWDETILRREILPSGKSRAFINDTPVTLQVMKRIASQLIDIHSQSQNLEIEEKSFQLEVIDVHAKLEKDLGVFLARYTTLKKLRANLDELKAKAAAAKSEQEFLQFQFDQLFNADIKTDEESLLEEEQNTLAHASEIKTTFSSIVHYLNNEETGAIPLVNSALKDARDKAQHSHSLQEIAGRLESVKIELADIASETEQLQENTEMDPERLNFVNERLSLLFDLKNKHQVEHVNDLVKLQQSLEKKLLATEHVDFEISALEKELNAAEDECHQLAHKLSSKRKKSFSAIEKYMKDSLKYLGMPNGQIKIEHHLLPEITSKGMDDIRFMFSANKNHAPQHLALVASGGEKSRLMLVIKTLLAQHKKLPTLIFDEIDTGISGDVAQKLAGQLELLSQNMQLLTITHLPQVASKANAHLKVYKQEVKGSTNTSIKNLSKEERVLELAEMLSGKNPSEAAILNAKELMTKDEQ